jgi:hypothetical protein
MKNKPKDPNAVAMGKKSWKTKTPERAAASRKNGKLGGRGNTREKRLANEAAEREAKRNQKKNTK